MQNYTREDDGDEMVQIAPHQFVSKRAADRLGLTLQKAPAKPAKPFTAATVRRAREKVPA